MVKKSPALSVLYFFLFSLAFCAAIAAFMLAKNTFFDKAPSPSYNDITLPTVIIDAGHGGRDGGTVGIDGVTVEKELNLDIAERMREILAKRGYEVIMTRSEDILLSDPMISSSKKASDLSARLKIMKSYENAVFISIHMNAFSDKKYSGLQVYYSKNDPRSATLAENIQSSVKEALQPENARKTKAAGENIYLLNKATCPAVMIECGFLSNPDECARLADENYRASLAAILCDSIRDYIFKNH